MQTNTRAPDIYCQREGFKTIQETPTEYIIRGLRMIPDFKYFEKIREHESYNFRDIVDAARNISVKYFGWKEKKLFEHLLEHAVGVGTDNMQDENLRPYINTALLVSFNKIKDYENKINEFLQEFADTHDLKPESLPTAIDACIFNNNYLSSEDLEKAGKIFSVFDSQFEKIYENCRELDPNPLYDYKCSFLTIPRYFGQLAPIECFYNALDFPPDKYVLKRLADFNPDSLDKKEEIRAYYKDMLARSQTMPRRYLIDKRFKVFDYLINNSIKDEKRSRISREKWHTLVSTAAFACCFSHTDYETFLERANIISKKKDLFPLELDEIKNFTKKTNLTKRRANQAEKIFHLIGNNFEDLYNFCTVHEKDERDYSPFKTEERFREKLTGDIFSKSPLLR